MSPRTARRYRLRTKLLLSFFSFCLAFLTCEAILRVIDYDYTPLRIDIVTEAGYVRHYQAFKDEHFRHDAKLIWRPNEDYSVFVTVHGFWTEIAFGPLFCVYFHTTSQLRSSKGCHGKWLGREGAMLTP